MDGDQADATTKNPKKKHSRNRATTVNQASIFEAKPTPWPASPVRGKIVAGLASQRNEPCEQPTSWL